MNTDEFSIRFLEKGKEHYEKGDKSELLYCLSHCIVHDVQIPDWLNRAFREAYDTGRLSKSWDDVFGKPLGKGKRLVTARRNDALESPIFESVQDRHKNGEAIDKNLFDSVGREFGVGGTVASELYYAFGKREFVLTDEDIINRKDR